MNTQTRTTTSCPSCGAPNAPGARACAHCGAALVAPPPLAPGAPETTVPFALTRHEATRAAEAWFRGNVLGLRPAVALEAVHAPCWLASGNTRVDWSGETTSDTQRALYHLPVAGTHEGRYATYVTASRAVPQGVIDALLPWPTDEGDDAERAPDLPVDVAYADAVAVATDRLSALGESRAAGLSEQLHAALTTVDDLALQLVWLPLYRTESGAYAVNGATGSVAGRMQWDWRRCLALVLAVILVVGTVLQMLVERI